MIMVRLELLTEVVLLQYLVKASCVITRKIITSWRINH